MKRVYRAENAFDAQLVRDLLLEAGIAAEVHGTMLTGAVGELPADNKAGVWIADADLYEWARQVIRRYENAAHESADWHCTHCGETNAGTFETCWHCGRPAEDDSTDGGTANGRE